jgi:chromosome segregation ATPase
MAEPTLKDVLAAITRLEKGQSEIRSEMATKADMNARFTEMNARFADVNARFADVNARFDRVDRNIADLDRDLDSHMKVHRELERDVEALKGRPLRTASRVRRSASKRPSK